MQDPDLDDVLIAKARRLAETPRGQASRHIGNDLIDPRTAPLVAQRICALEIPLPPGYNSAAHVGWLGEDMGQVTTISLARSVLQANAFRDWLWFGTHHLLGEAQLEAFELVLGHRPALRHPLPLREVVEAAKRQRLTDEHRRLACRNFPDLDGQPGPAPTAELWAGRLVAGREAGRVTATGQVTWGSRGL